MTVVSFLAAIFIPLGLFQFLGLENALPLALFVTIVILWLTELIPLAATALLVPVLAISYGIFNSQTAFLPFGNQVLFLFLGSFLLCAAMQKHGWDKRLAYTILSLRKGCSTTNQLFVIFALICWTLSMWISNTAATAIVAPMAIAIMNTLKSNFKDPKEYHNFSVRLLLTCAFASSIGGMATPVGSPPNLLALEFLANKGVHIDFIQWMGFAVPISLIMLVALFIILSWSFPVKSMSFTEVQKLFREKRKNLGPLKVPELQVAFSFFLAVFLWTLPGTLRLILGPTELVNTLTTRLPMGGVALLSALLLFIFPIEGGRNLKWSDAKSIDWGTIILFGGGLALGSVLDKSGLAKELGQILFGTDLEPFIWIGAMAILAGILMSEFSSNTASTSIIVPILLGTFSSINPDIAKTLVIATTFGASFGFMLPVSTPPNAIVYGTGKIRLREMIRTGILFDISGFLLILLFVVVIFPWLGLL